MRRELEVFGKRMVVERIKDAWHVYEPATDGKRSSVAGVLVPSFVVTEAELAQHLADIFHERATPANNRVRWLA